MSMISPVAVLSINGAKREQVLSNTNNFLWHCFLSVLTLLLEFWWDFLVQLRSHKYPFVCLQFYYVSFFKAQQKQLWSLPLPAFSPSSDIPFFLLMPKYEENLLYQIW